MILQNSIALGGSPAPAAYQIERSLRFNSADSAHLNWTPAQSGNRKTWTLNCWVKRSGISVNDAIFSTSYTSLSAARFWFQSDNTLEFNTYRSGGAADNYRLLTTQLFRDLSAWYMITLVWDTTQATASNRMKLYVNGVQITTFTTATYPTQDYELSPVNNSGWIHYLGRSPGDSAHSNFYLAEVNFIDGQALTPSDFGETSSSTGVWIPKAYTGSYGQNGFYLPFNDNSTVLNLGRNRQTLTADPYFPYTTLLLNGNGTNGAQNNTFLDSSSNNFTITRNGNTTQGTFSPFSQSGWSNFFNGSTDYFYFAAQSGFSFGTGDWAIETFVYLTSTADQAIYDARPTSTNGLYPLVDIAGGKFRYYTNSASRIESDSTFSTNRWYHIVVSRVSGTTRMFIDGTVQSTTYTDSNNYIVGTNRPTIGVGGFNLTAHLSGYMSNMRVLKGSGYTSVTVPTAPLTAVTGTQLLTCQANRFIDSSSNAYAITVSGTPSVQAFSPFTPTAAYSAATNGGSGYFDGSGDFLSYTTTALGSGDFTIEGWVYLLANNAFGGFWCVFNGATGTGCWFGIKNTGVLAFEIGNGAATSLSLFGTTALPTNTWVYVAARRSGTDVNIYVNGTSVANGTSSANIAVTSATIGRLYNNLDQNYMTGYISSLRVSNNARTISVPTSPYTSDANTSLLTNFTNAGITDATAKNDLETVGNAQISTTQSKWGGSSMYFDGTGDYLITPSKLADFGSGNFTVEGWVYIANTSVARFVADSRNSGSDAGFGLYFEDSTGYKLSVYRNNALLFRSSSTVSANTWYHIAFVRNGTTSYLFIDGTQVASASDTNTYTQAGSFRVGAGWNNSDAMNGYIDDLRITKGLARYTGNFTVPAAQFAYNTADINVKQWVPNNFSVTAGVGNDSLVDSPTNYGTDTGAGGEVRGNYATLNPLVASTGATLTNGNLDVVGTTTAYANSRATFQLNSGKWYWEVTLTGSGAAGFPWGVGLTTEAGPASSSNITQTGFYSVWNGNTGNVNKTTNGGTAVLIATTNWAQNDVIMVAYDADTGNIWFGRNGTWYPPTNGGSAGNPAAGTNVTISGVSGLIPVCHTYSTSSNQVVNFGQRPFAYTAPSGFKALCTQNLPTPAIGASAGTLASKNFGIVAWTGTDTTQNRSITGVGFQPDFVWSKSRSSAYSHPWYDAVRGVGKGLFSNVTDAEYTNEASGYISSFDSDGFTAAKGSANNNFFNQLNVTYVAWNWKANGAGVSNTAGSISSTVSANTTAGISVVTYTGNGSAGATVGHGLGVTPAMAILKNRSATASWIVFHKSTTTQASGNVWDSSVVNIGSKSGGVLNLNLTAAAGAYNMDAQTNGSGNNHVAYCFAEIAGFSRFGSYTGNGSADGPFVYCGFRPRYILMKRTDAVTDWEILDTLRDPYNAAANLLQPNLTSAESSTGGPWYDILSNGFKVRTTNTFFNASGGTYIFAAFAEAPFNYARAR